MLFVISIHVSQINRTKQSKIVEATFEICVSPVKRKRLLAQYGKRLSKARQLAG